MQPLRIISTAATRPLRYLSSSVRLPAMPGMALRNNSSGQRSPTRPLASVPWPWTWPLTSPGIIARSDASTHVRVRAARPFQGGRSQDCVALDQDIGGERSAAPQIDEATVADNLKGASHDFSGEDGTASCNLRAAGKT